MSFIFDEYKILVAGDTLFKGSIGRTDLPGGDFNEIVKSIRDKLYSLDDELTVIKGHGPSTQIGIEKTENMFVREP
jgi:glyoxylase-like metal-dependent hydrolase (beta-lactamase superfamily II)